MTYSASFLAGGIEQNIPANSHSADANLLSGIQNTLDNLRHTAADTLRDARIGYRDINRGFNHVEGLSNRNRNDILVTVDGISAANDGILANRDSILATRDEVLDASMENLAMLRMMDAQYVQGQAEIMNALTAVRLQQQTMQTTAQGETRVAITEVLQLFQAMTQLVQKCVCAGVIGGIVVVCLVVVFRMVADYLHGLFPTAQTQDYLGW